MDDRSLHLKFSISDKILSDVFNACFIFLRNICAICIIQISSEPLTQPSHIEEKTIHSISDSFDSQQLVISLKSKITDQEEQIQTLVKKRRDDLEKIKEFERTKLQLDQVRL